MNVLLVEDDPRVGALLVEGLRNEGMKVTLCTTAEDALHKLDSRSFDAIITDSMLPGKSGTQFCAEIRSRGMTIPTLMLTALDAVEERIAGLRAGADDYLTKPFDFEELIARIEAITRRYGGGDRRPEALQIGNVKLDRDTRTVTLAGRNVAMTATEFKLLEMLMASAGSVISRVHILHQVWGHDTDPLTNVVDVYIRRLRMKLLFDIEQGPIRCIRGFGYMYDADQPSGLADAADR